MSESLFVFLVTAALLLALRGVRARRRRWRFVALGVVLGLAVLDPRRGRRARRSCCSPVSLAARATARRSGAASGSRRSALR